MRLDPHRRVVVPASRLAFIAELPYHAHVHARPLPQILDELYKVRSFEPEPPFEKLSFGYRERQETMLEELATEISAPLPAPPASAPSPRPYKGSNLHRLRANRPPRSDLLEAMEIYDNTIPSDLAAIVARRPDLAPFDIHYVMNSPDHPQKKRPRVLTTVKPVGVSSPLSALTIAALADDHLLSAIGGHSLHRYSVKYRCEDSVAHLDLHPYADGKKIITFHQDHLWRDLIIWPSEFTDEDANT